MIIGQEVSTVIKGSTYFFFDFTELNPEIAGMDFADPLICGEYIQSKLDNYRILGIGKYNEDRIIYRQSLSVSRSVHLGMDLFVAPGTPVFAPLTGRVHSFQDNNAKGDYGPTIILEHHLEGKTFYTLYGHLSRESLSLEVGQVINKGEEFATIGTHLVNGNWPPHLHFQIINDMLGKEGDFPGVCSVSERDYWLSICPDPEMILKVR
jgi:murein DD-endopeptidase MepM/ murein hydrolase activator NlpD